MNTTTTGDRQFHSAVGNWDAVFIDTDADVPTWRTEPIIGWFVFMPDDQDAAFDVVPVLGGETVEPNDEWIGIYRTSDLSDADVQHRLSDVCASAFEARRRNARKHGVGVLQDGTQPERMR